MRVRSLFVSDVHLGCGFSRAGELFDFLGRFEPDRLYLDGSMELVAHDAIGKPGHGNGSPAGQRPLFPEAVGSEGPLPEIAARLAPLMFSGRLARS